MNVHDIYISMSQCKNFMCLYIEINTRLMIDDQDLALNYKGCSINMQKVSWFVLVISGMTYLFFTVCSLFYFETMYKNMKAFVQRFMNSCFCSNTTLCYLAQFGQITNNTCQWIDVVCLSVSLYVWYPHFG